MAMAEVFRHVAERLRNVGRVSPAAELHSEDFGPGPDEPCPREHEYPLCTLLEASPCRIPFPSFSSTPPSRCC